VKLLQSNRTNKPAPSRTRAVKGYDDGFLFLRQAFI
jgi:hypothetical protein